MKNCLRCNNVIEFDRLNVLPDTNWCVSCAKAINPSRVKGRMCFDHKTAPSICIMTSDVFDETTKYYVPNGARSVVKNFSKHICA